MKTKHCSKCGAEKAVTEYSRDKRGKDGLRSRCKACAKQYNKQYRADNREAIAEYMDQWRTDNADHIAEYRKQYQADNREAIAEYNKQRREDNPEYFVSRKHHQAEVVARRRFGLACPEWLTNEHRAEILAAYEEARRLTEETGVRHEVDHIVPLTNDAVCGLHVPWNLQVLPKRENAAKGNKLIEEMIHA